MADQQDFGLADGVGGSNEAYDAQQARERAAQKLANATFRPSTSATLTAVNKTTGEQMEIPLGSRRIPRSQF